MSGFKFDKNNEELDLSLGSDDALGAQNNAKKPAQKQQLPKPAIKQPTVEPKTPPAAPQKPPISSTKPAAKPVPKPAAKPPVASKPVVTPPVTSPEPAIVAPAPPAPAQQQTPPPLPVTAPEPIASPEEAYSPQNNQQPSQSPIIPLQQVKSVKEKTQKRPRKKETNSFSGNRKVVLIVRIAAGVVGGVIIFSGLNSIFFPPNFPTPNQVIAKVKEGLNITGFPTQKATGFVINFTEAYFTVDPNNYGTRDDVLSQYISENLLQETDLVFNRAAISDNPNEKPLGQSIVGVPAIVSTYSIDDNNAVFTVQVTLSTGTTMYVDIPVYWNPDNNGMAISAPMSLVPAIGLTKIPQDNLLTEWNNDKDVVEAFEADLKKYLEAWSASDETSINRYTTDKATLMAKLGLGGTVQLERLENLEVEGVTETTTDPKTRNARISVVWKDANNPAFTYKQSYMLVIKQKPDEKWYVDNINSIVIK